jgi:hypothetical protein
MTLTVTVAMIMVVTVWSTLIFQGGRTGQGKGVVASFWLVPENQGVGASFRLELENHRVVASF